MEKEREKEKEYRLKERVYLREMHFKSRLNCLEAIKLYKKQPYPGEFNAYKLRAREICTTHSFWERLLIKRRIPLLHPSIISQISEEYIDLDAKPIGYIDHLGDAIIEDY